MNSPDGSPTSGRSSNVSLGVLKRFIQITTTLLIQGVILFGVAGRLAWVWAWVFLGISILGVIVNGIIFLRKNPEMIAERGNAKLTQTWDKVVAGIYGISLFLVVPLVAGLDARWGWTREWNPAWNVAGGIGMALALGFASWAMIVNAFFSTAARVQTERGHTVCQTGPYRLVRHPGYLGFILQALMIPVLLGSAWALAPGVVAASALAVRTFFEDRMLQTELVGYREYAQKVRFRLLAGIW